MNRRSLAALIFLNLVLVVALVMTSFTSEQSIAQDFGSSGGKYTMISGKIQGRSKNDGIYIIERGQGNVIAAYYDGSSKKFKTIRGINVPNDLQKPATTR